MKVLLGATAALLLLATPALAQTGTAAQCAFTAAPALPDGATATREAMAAKQTEMTAWVTTRQQEEAACQQAINALTAAFNAAGPERTTAVGTWNAQLQAFNARAQSTTPAARRERGSVLTRPDGR